MISPDPPPAGMPQIPNSIQGPIPGTPLVPPPTAVILPSRVEALLYRLEQKIKADEAKVESVWQRYWPAFAALIVGVILGHVL